MATVRAHFEAAERKGRLSAEQARAQLARVRPTLDMADLGQADLVIEALQATVFVSSPERVDPGQPGAVDIQLGRTRLGGRDGILVEAKSVLPSRGELIRQLRHYATVFRGPMVVVSPDNSYAKLLRAQGFRFVQCPKDLP